MMIRVEIDVVVGLVTDENAAVVPLGKFQWVRF
jgi:hypothetical protein